MDFNFMLGILILVALVFFIYSTYTFQVFLRSKTLKKNFSDEFVGQVKGLFHPFGYYSFSHKVISIASHKKLPNREKVNYNYCYNIVSFKTNDASWEVFFHLIKERARFKQYMTIRCFPTHHRIRSQANIEMARGNLSIFTNNHYLTSILEKHHEKELIKSFLRNNGDAFHISRGTLHVEILLDSAGMNAQRAMNIIKGINTIKGKVFKDGVLEY